MIVYEEKDGALNKLSNADNVLESTNPQVILSTLTKPALVKWLKVHEFPEPFFEDMASEEQSPVYEEFSEGFLLIAKYLRLEKDAFLEFYEENVALIMLDTKLFIVCKDGATLNDLATKLDRRIRAKKSSIFYALYCMQDILTDQQLQTIDLVNLELENLEDIIISEKDKKSETLKNLYYARRSLGRLGHLFVHESSSYSRYFTNMSNSLKKRFRFELSDLKEHKQMLTTDCRVLQDKTANLVNLQLGIANNRANEAMQKLAAVSIIFIPLTFISSIYGMNFENMPELKMDYSYYIALGSMTTIALSIFAWLRKKRYL